MSFAEHAFGATLKLVNTVLEHPATADALQRTGELRETVLAVQEVVLGVLNLPTAADVSRLDARLRSASQRLESIEDALEDIGGQVGAVPALLRGFEARVSSAAAADASAQRA
ncbi:hypothetical protein ACFYO1_11705 [Nocardia sp. NPDC006044]|uniref:hypothetical protein n=1 Tax=Nocardia sp. NPDC006044 TaxID=3364306 RepID=UPI003690F00E